MNDFADLTDVGGKEFHSDILAECEKRRVRRGRAEDNELSFPLRSVCDCFWALWLTNGRPFRSYSFRYVAFTVVM